MYTALVVVHVISMVASMTIMMGAIGLGLLGRTSAAHAATVGMILTALGAISGSILLLTSPLMSECIILASYLSVATALYIFGFGSGFADRARLIRRKTNE